MAYVKSVNLKRRQLTGSQRWAAIVACSEWRPAHREKKSAVTAGLRAPTSAQMAKEADVGVRTIEHAKAAHSAGVDDAVRDGRITAERGAQIAKLPAAERAAAVDAPKPAKAPVVKQAEEDRIAFEAFGDFDPVAELSTAQKEIGSLQAQLLAAEADAQKAETLKWVYGDDLGNMRRMIDLNLKVQNNAADAPDASFDPQSGQFLDSDGREFG